LYALDGIGKYTAQILDNSGMTLQDFYSKTEDEIEQHITACMNSCELKQQLHSNIMRKILSNKKYFLPVTDLSDQDTAAYYNRQKELISSIPGIAEPTAELILNHIDFVDIFSEGAGSKTKIANIPRGANRKIGDKLAERIISYFGIVE
jgi:hypothetical protein